MKKFSLFFFFLWLFETQFLCVILAVLKLTLYTRLAQDSEICLFLPQVLELNLYANMSRFFKTLLFFPFFFSLKEKCQL